MGLCLGPVEVLAADRARGAGRQKMLLTMEYFAAVGVLKSLRQLGLIRE